MPVRDDLLNLSPAGSDLPLIATNRMSANTLDLEGTPPHGLAIRMNVEYAHGSAVVPVIQAIVHGGSSTPVMSSEPIVATGIALSATGLTGHREQIIPFVTRYRYIRVEFTTTGVASDSPSFSQVEAYVVENVAFDWTRQVEFH